MLCPMDPLKRTTSVYKTWLAGLKDFPPSLPLSDPSLTGKYLNNYALPASGMGVEHIPPGWDTWYTLKGNRYKKLRACQVDWRYSLEENTVARP